MKTRARRPKTLAIVLAVLLLGACEPGAAPEGVDSDATRRADTPTRGVYLQADDQRNLGLSVERLDAAQFQPRIEGPGVVIDVQPVVRVMADLMAAEAAARQSRAALDRAAALFDAGAAVSKEIVEAAERQAAADEAALDVARAEGVVAFGNAAPWLETTRRPEIMNALTSGVAVVVRTSFPAGFPAGLPPEIRLRRVGAHDDREAWRTDEVWLGPADPDVPGPSLLAYVEPAPGLVSGSRIVASIATGTGLQGVVVPASAVVFAGGAAWCYVAAETDLFVRTAIDLDRPTENGYFQARGFEPGQRVVVAGAGLLLARELGGAEEED